MAILTTAQKRDAVALINAKQITLRDPVAMNGGTMNIRMASDAVPVGTQTVVGARFQVSDGIVSSYHRVINVVTVKVGVSAEFVGVNFAPLFTAQGYNVGSTIDFVPFASDKATIPAQTVKNNESLTLDLSQYFEMVGGKDSDLTYVATPGGPQFSVTAKGALVTIKAAAVGTAKLTIQAFDKSQGSSSQTFDVTVQPANRAPASTQAIGDHDVVVGGQIVFNLADYFTDPDGDALSYSIRNAKADIATATLVGSTLTITGVAQGHYQLDVDASDGTLDIGQQAQITVPANRKPVVSQHLPKLALAVGGSDITLDLDTYFSDPDGTDLQYLLQWEEGDASHQYRQEFWYPHTQQGSSTLLCTSVYPYRPGVTQPPWGSGAAWSVPAGQTFHLYRLSGGTVTHHELTTQGTATATWDGPNREVDLTLQFTAAIPGGASDSVIGYFGDDVAIVDVERTGQTGNIILRPGATPGHRTLYIQAYDPGGLETSQFGAVSLGQAPTVANAIADYDLIAGSDAPLVDLYNVFTDPDKKGMTFSVTESDPHYVKAVIDQRPVQDAKGDLVDQATLHVHGLTVGVVTVTVTATDADSLTVSDDFVVTVLESAAVALPPLLSPTLTITTIRRQFESEGTAAELIETTPGSVPHQGESWSVYYDALLPRWEQGYAGDTRIHLRQGLPIVTTPIVVGERFTIQGDSEVYTVEFTRASGSIRRTYYVRFSPPFAVDQNVGDRVTWLPSRSLQTRTLIPLISDTLTPSDFSTIRDYVGSILVKIPWSEAYTVSAGATIEIQGQTLVVDSVTTRLYRDDPIYYEAYLLPPQD